MEHHSNYYAVIPADVRYDERLTANAKLLYGEITALCNQNGFCWAMNDHFAKLYSVSKRTISEWISQLNECGHIRLEMEDKGNGNGELQRLIYITPINFSLIHPRKKTSPPQEENFYYNNKRNNKEKDFSSLAGQDERDGSVSDKKPIQIKIADRVIQTLNKMTGKKYQNTQANRKHILARLNEGYVLKDFIQVVRTKKQDPYFISNPKYMRPETLFGSKFDTYLNESPEEYSEETTPTSKSNGVALPPKNPYSPTTTKPYENLLTDPSPANLAQLYRNLQGIEKWVQGIDYEHYKNHTVVYHNYRRWKNFADRLVEWIEEEGFPPPDRRGPNIFDVNGGIWKQFLIRYILPEIFKRDRIKMTWDKY